MSQRIIATAPIFDAVAAPGGCASPGVLGVGGSKADGTVIMSAHVRLLQSPDRVRRLFSRPPARGRRSVACRPHRRSVAKQGDCRMTIDHERL